MSNVLKYKDYLGSIEYDLDDDYLYGEILFINDKVIYEGQTLSELKNSFEQAVDGYLEFCQELGKSPDVACSGSFNIRISPKLHLACLKNAKEQGLSLNAYIGRQLESLMSLTV